MPSRCARISRKMTNRSNTNMLAEKSKVPSSHTIKIFKRFYIFGLVSPKHEERTVFVMITGKIWYAESKIQPKNVRDKSVRLGATIKYK